MFSVLVLENAELCAFNLNIDIAHLQELPCMIHVERQYFASVNVAVSVRIFHIRTNMLDRLPTCLTDKHNKNSQNFGSFSLTISD